MIFSSRNGKKNLLREKAKLKQTRAVRDAPTLAKLSANELQSCLTCERENCNIEEIVQTSSTQSASRKGYDKEEDPVVLPNKNPLQPVP